MSRHAILLCEGYHDRAFLSGWLEHVRGWSKPESTSGRVRDPLGRPLAGGRFGFERNRAFAVVAPCGGWPAIRKCAGDHLAQAALNGDQTGNIDALIACYDDDVDKDFERSMEDMVRQSGQPSDRASLPVQVLRLRATDDRWHPSLGGLVAQAFAEAHPRRWPAVATWLASRDDGAQDASQDGKSAKWSVMAGWYARQGCDGFLRHEIWCDVAVRARLEQHLSALDFDRLAEQIEA
ncbi:MAG: hypothetical protein U1F36_14910 [Planctomycetota bacterium]